MKKTIFYPVKHDNPYVSIVTEAIKKAGYELYDLPEIKGNHKLAKEIKIINLNWFDSIGGCPRWKALALLMRQIIRVRYYKHCGMKIIYTMHNRQAHDTEYSRINRYLMEYLCKEADRIAVLCTYSKTILLDYLSKEEIDEKVRVMYHPSYEGAYVNSDKIIPELSRDKDKMHILFLGSVRPYKNIELILDAAAQLKDKKIEIVIAGHPTTTEYRDSILKMSNGLGNIKTILRFVRDEEMSSFYHWADVVLIPLSIKSSLNSGSTVLAFTMGKTVIAPLIGTLRDFPRELMFAYEYEDEKDHLKALVEQITAAYSIWLQNPETIVSMGMRVQKYLNVNFSKEKTYERYKELYGELSE